MQIIIYFVSFILLLCTMLVKKVKVVYLSIPIQKLTMFKNNFIINGPISFSKIRSLNIPIYVFINVTLKIWCHLRLLHKNRFRVIFLREEETVIYSEINPKVRKIFDK